MKILNEIKKEDDLYFQGAFWIKTPFFIDILKGNFELIIGSKLLSNYNGDIINNTNSKNSLTHQHLWRTVGDENPWNYYPRGRVSIYNGVAYLHLNSKCNIPKVIDAIIDEYEIDKLEKYIDLNDTYQGSHYDFLLK